MTNSTDKGSGDQRLEEILEIIKLIAQKSIEGGYLFRGEAKCYENVSSGLYREIMRGVSEPFDVEEIQQRHLDTSKRFTTETDDVQILTQLQHYGDITNLIDFTTDYHISLFFACDGAPDETGRVILLRANEDEANAQIFRPTIPLNRVLAQKSVFVRPRKGIVLPNDIIPIPPEMKQPILKHLRRSHGISRETIYNDLLGFIKVRRAQRAAEDECDTGHAYHQNRDYGKAIEHYSRAIETDPQMFVALVNRSDAYCKIACYERAAQDADLAIEIYPHHPAPYNNRGNAYGNQGLNDWAIEDFSKAIELDPQHYSAFVNRGNAYANKGDYERAVQEYNAAIGISSDQVEVYCHRGLAYGYLGDTELAIGDFTSAIELDPSCAQAFANRANAYILQGRLTHAIDDCNIGISLEPEGAINYYNRAIALTGLGKWEEAHSDISKATSLGYAVAKTFLDDHASLRKFETKYEVKIPDHLAAELATQERAHPTSSNRA